MNHFPAKRPRESGYVLVTSLLMLVVVTILAVSMFRSYGVEEKIAGNVRDKQRALHAAETAQQYAERILGQGGVPPAAINCTVPIDTTVGIQVCTNGLADPRALPWAAPVTYTPQLSPTSKMTYQTGNTVIAGSYYQAPRFYITYLGGSPSVKGGVIYQIDAAGYGGSPSSVAVVESTFLVQSGVKCLGGC